MGWTRQEVLDVARSTGRPVVEAWSTHDAGQMGTVLGPMLHHTGSTWSYPTNTAPTLRTVREGRSDLQNSLSMYYIDYEGVIYCISEKLSWHAGAGSWQGVTDGNGHYAGIEAESDGQQWTAATVAAYKRLAAAILRKTGRTVAYAPLHRQYALPPGRKTDFSGLDPATFLADVNADLSGNPQEDDMYGDAQRNEIVPALYEVVGNTRSTNMQVAADAIKIDAILAAVKGQPVDVAALGDRIAANLVPAVVAAVNAKAGGAGISKDDVEAAIREVLGSLK